MTTETLVGKNSSDRRAQMKEGHKPLSNQESSHRHHGPPAAPVHKGPLLLSGTLSYDSQCSANRLSTLTITVLTLTVDSYLQVLQCL